MVQLKEVSTPLKLKLLKLSKSGWIATVIIAILAGSTAATAYYYYVMPHPARLRILYTHSDKMVNEVANNFASWYKKRYGRPIEVTLTLVNPQSVYETVKNPHRKPEAEIWWGGPLSLFKEAYKYLLPYDSTRKNEINKTVHSCPLMDPNQTHTRWYAASLYALGVMYNEHVLKALNLSIPQTWADLLKEEYEEKLAITDPTRSEYTQPFIMLVIQSQNWTQGWEYLVKLAAFVRDFDNTEVNSVLKVASGYLPLAIVPDFYAYDKMAVPIPNLNFTYLNATVLQPDPIAIIKRGDYREEAKAFVNYILSEEAQNIIAQYCLPVRQNVTVTPPRISPFDQNFPYIPNYNLTFEEIGKEIVRAYFNYTVAERHEQIKMAWKEIEEANKTSPYYELALNNFTFASYYVNRTEINSIYNETNGWTENTATYIEEWREASEKAYSNAIENARKAKE